MYNDIPVCMIEVAFYDAIAEVHYKAYKAEFKDKELSNGFLPDEFKNDVYDILNSRMKKAIEVTRKANIAANKNHEKEIKAYRKKYRNSTMMQPLVKAKKVIAQEMYNLDIYEYEKFAVRFVEILKDEYEKQKSALANC